MNKILPLLSAIFFLAACSSTTATPPPSQSAPAAQKTVPVFSADSAFLYVSQQLDFGPRVPGTNAQEQCAAWLHTELERHGAKVYESRSTVRTYDGKKLPCINLVGSYNPEAKRRVLLMAHWDSRHISDADPDVLKRQEPVMAANDGASGVGVLLEIARLAGEKAPALGIDIFLTDVEDYGAPDDWEGNHDDKDWALGTQEWCKRPHVQGYRAIYGILLDMVGSGEATFYREYYSNRYAADVLNHVWQTAAQLGYRDLFINQDGAGITDDHVFVNREMNIPTIDIIDTRMQGDGTFYPYWHTTEDTLDKISPETLRKVGDVLVHLLW